MIIKLVSSALTFSAVAFSTTFYSSASLFLAAYSNLSYRLTLLRSTVSLNLSRASYYLWRTLMHHCFLDISIFARRCSAFCWRSCCFAWSLAGDNLRPLLISFLCTSSNSTFPIAFPVGASDLLLYGVISSDAFDEEVWVVTTVPPWAPDWDGLALPLPLLEALDFFPLPDVGVGMLKTTFFTPLVVLIEVVVVEDLAEVYLYWVGSASEVEAAADCMLTGSRVTSAIGVSFCFFLEGRSLDGLDYI